MFSNIKLKRLNKIRKTLKENITFYKRGIHHFL